MEKQRHSKKDLTCRSIPSEFYSQNVRCSATLHLPAKKNNQPLPAILMVHGWGGVQDALTTPFYEEFTRAGYAVMTFDYRGWGSSAGLPRNTIQSRARVQDAEAALAHLKSLSNIDASRIVLWGSSFGGGHVIELAAKHQELLGAIAQVPMLDGLKTIKAVPFKQLLKFGVSSMADLLKPGRPIYIPTIGKPGEFSTMDRDDAYKALEQGIANNELSYDNRVTARSLLTMGPYRPFQHLKKVRVPTLIIGGTRDTVAPFIPRTIEKIGNPNITLESLSANHFEPYFEPVFSDLIEMELKFLANLNIHQCS